MGVFGPGFKEEDIEGKSLKFFVCVVVVFLGRLGNYVFEGTIRLNIFIFISLIQT